MSDLLWKKPIDMMAFSAYKQYLMKWFVQELIFINLLKYHFKIGLFNNLYAWFRVRKLKTEDNMKV